MLLWKREMYCTFLFQTFFIIISIIFCNVILENVIFNDYYPILIFCLIHQRTKMKCFRKLFIIPSLKQDQYNWLVKCFLFLWVGSVWLFSAPWIASCGHLFLQPDFYSVNVKHLFWHPAYQKFSTNGSLNPVNVVLIYFIFYVKKLKCLICCGFVVIFPVLRKDESFSLFLLLPAHLWLLMSS